MVDKELLDNEPIHAWFQLSYASYLVLPRSVLQSAPLEWQKKFVDCLRELESMFGDVPVEGCYHVQLRDVGKFVTDYFRNYERGRRRIERRDLKGKEV